MISAKLNINQDRKKLPWDGKKKKREQRTGDPKNAQNGRWFEINPSWNGGEGINMAVWRRLNRMTQLGDTLEVF